MARTPTTVDSRVAQRVGDPEFVRHHMLHGHETMPTRRVPRGTVEHWRPAESPHDLDELSLTLGRRRPVTLRDFLTEAESDAILVMRRGKIVYERYLHGM